MKISLKTVTIYGTRKTYVEGTVKDVTQISAYKAVNSVYKSGIVQKPGSQK